MLTILAVSVGVISIVTLSSHVEGMQASLISNLEKLGPTTILIISSGGSPLTDADVSRLSTLPDVSKVIPTLRVTTKVPGIDDPVTLIGISSLDLVDMIGELRFTEGNMYVDAPAPQAVIGYNIAYDPATGKKQYEAGGVVLVRMKGSSIPLTIVGVFDTYGTAVAVSPDDSIFIPIEFLKKATRAAKYNILIVKAKDADSVEKVTEMLKNVYGGRAQVLSVQQISRTITQIVSQFNILLVSIASTSFIAAGLGTFNIMMISVLERVREIGILKALGMKDRQVLTLYVNQGMLIGLMGSLLGLGGGILITYALPSIFTTPRSAPEARMMMPSYSPVINPTYAFLSVFLSIIVTLVSTAYPAWKASKLRPVEALRYE